MMYVLLNADTFNFKYLTLNIFKQFSYIFDREFFVGDIYVII